MDTQEISQNHFSRGNLTEVSGPQGGGKTELVLQFLAQNPTLNVAWIEEGLGIYPVSLEQKGVGLERVLFVDSKSSEESAWAAQQILKSGLFGAVILSHPKKTSEILLRRIQLAAEKAGAFVFLLNERTTDVGAWPIAHQLWVRRNEAQQIQSQTIRCRVWKQVAFRPVG